MPATVTVGSKLPFPLTLELPGDGDGETRKVVIRGNAVRPGQLPRHLVGGVEKIARVDNAEQSYLAGSAALTPGVDAAFWEAWSTAYAKAPYVKSGLVFAHAQTASVESIARERREVVTGLEGIDPDRPAPQLAPLKN